MPTTLWPSVTSSDRPWRDAERAERGDERRDVDERDQHAVGEAEAQHRRRAPRKAQASPMPVAITVTASTTDAKVEHRADRQIEALGHDDDRHRQRQQQQDGRLREDVRRYWPASRIPGSSTPNSRAQHHQHDGDARHAGERQWTVRAQIRGVAHWWIPRRTMLASVSS